jgi:hypothetical protein
MPKITTFSAEKVLIEKRRPVRTSQEKFWLEEGVRAGKPAGVENRVKGNRQRLGQFLPSGKRGNLYEIENYTRRRKPCGSPTEGMTRHRSSPLSPGTEPAA